MDPRQEMDPIQALQDSQYRHEITHNNDLIMKGVIGRLDALYTRVTHIPRQFERTYTDEEKAKNLENLRQAIQNARKRYPGLDLSKYEKHGGKSRHRRSRRNKKQSKRSGKNNKKRKTSRSRKMRKTRRNNKTRT